MEQFLIHQTVEENNYNVEKIVEKVVSKYFQVKEPAAPEYLTRHEVAQRLHVSLPTLNRLHRDKILTARKIGGRVLYTLESIENALQQGQNLKYRRK